MPTFVEVALRATVLCPLPVQVQRVLELANAPSPDLHHLGSEIRKDPALTTSVLQLANGASQGLREPLTDVHRAVVRIGLAEIQNVAMAHAMVAAFASRHERSGLVHARCVVAGTVARELSFATGLSASDAYLAGLLSELGSLVCLAVDGDAYEPHVEAPLEERGRRERELYGATSRSIGARVLAFHGLPPTLIEAVRVEDDEPAEALGRVVRFCRAGADALIARAEVGVLRDEMLGLLTQWAARDELDVDPENAWSVLVAAGAEVGRSLTA
ncbi:MAG: HDOD domain-containing protein [Sandaracinus sp.]|nr:HDOD domain-containing protein [Sandaracinus sp.]